MGFADCGDWCSRGFGDRVGAVAFLGVAVLVGVVGDVGAHEFGTAHFHLSGDCTTTYRPSQSAYQRWNVDCDGDGDLDGRGSTTTMGRTCPATLPGDATVCDTTCSDGTKATEQSWCEAPLQVEFPNALTSTSGGSSLGQIATTAQGVVQAYRSLGAVSGITTTDRSTNFDTRISEFQEKLNGLITKVNQFSCAAGIAGALLGAVGVSGEPGQPDPRFPVDSDGNPLEPPEGVTWHIPDGWVPHPELEDHWCPVGRRGNTQLGRCLWYQDPPEGQRFLDSLFGGGFGGIVAMIPILKDILGGVTTSFAALTQGNCHHRAGEAASQGLLQVSSLMAQVQNDTLSILGPLSSAERPGDYFRVAASLDDLIAGGESVSDKYEDYMANAGARDYSGDLNQHVAQLLQEVQNQSLGIFTQNELLFGDVTPAEFQGTAGTPGRAPVTVAFRQCNARCTAGAYDTADVVFDQPNFLRTITHRWSNLTNSQACLMAFNDGTGLSAAQVELFDELDDFGTRKVFSAASQCWVQWSGLRAFSGEYNVASTGLSLVGSGGAAVVMRITDQGVDAVDAVPGGSFSSSGDGATYYPFNEGAGGQGSPDAVTWYREIAPSPDYDRVVDIVSAPPADAIPQMSDMSMTPAVPGACIPEYAAPEGDAAEGFVGAMRKIRSYMTYEIRRSDMGRFLCGIAGPDTSAVASLEHLCFATGNTDKIYDTGEKTLTWGSRSTTYQIMDVPELCIYGPKAPSYWSTLWTFLTFVSGLLATAAVWGMWIRR